MAGPLPPVKRVPVREGLLSETLSELSAVRLLASRCRRCEETALGVSDLCQNCGADDLKRLTLGREGKLWTYTIVRHKPPGDYRGPDPFVPFGLGLVEMPEGLRVLAPIGGDLDDLHIGQALIFKPIILDGDDGIELVAFKFQPVAA